MAFKAVRITTGGAAVPLLVQGAGAGQFVDISGIVSDPLSVVIENCDATNSVDIGGSGVTAGGGVPLAAGAILVLALYGPNGNIDIPYAIADAGTPSVAVMVGRQ